MNYTAPDYFETLEVIRKKCTKKENEAVNRLFFWMYEDEINEDELIQKLKELLQPEQYILKRFPLTNSIWD